MTTIQDRFLRVLFTIFAVLALHQCAMGQEKTIDLWPDGAPGALGSEDKDRPKLTIHLPEKEQAGGAAVIVLPGGGYQGLAIGYEGHDIATWFNSLGGSGFVVDYRHRGKGYGHPAPLQDAQRAIRTVRARANEWGIDPQRIGVIGFSAGGHLASSTGVFFEDGKPDAADPIDRVSSRPDFLILCYPVIAFNEPYTHVGSQRNLLGENATAEQLAAMSTEKHVRSDSPPTFLWSTSEDEPVPAENSVQFYLALKKAGVPAELHIFAKGQHGLGLAKDTPGARAWPELCHAWLVGQGVIKK